MDDREHYLFASSIPRALYTYRRDVTTQYYLNPNPNHKNSAKFSLRTPLALMEKIKSWYERLLLGYTLGLGALACEADPNQVEER